MTIPAGTTAKIKYYKPDGKFVLNNATINGNVITVTYTEQMLAVSGTGRGEIVLYNGTAVLRSATYYTKITPTVYKENGLISDNEFLDMAESIIAMNKQIDKAINATKSAEQMPIQQRQQQTAQRKQEMQQQQPGTMQPRRQTMQQRQQMRRQTA